MNINHLDSVKLDVGTNTNLAEIKFKPKMVWINSYSYFVAIFSVSAIQISTKLATLCVSRVADMHPFSKLQTKLKQSWERKPSLCLIYQSHSKYYGDLPSLTRSFVCACLAIFPSLVRFWMSHNRISIIQQNALSSFLVGLSVSQFSGKACSQLKLALRCIILSCLYWSSVKFSQVSDTKSLAKRRK